MSNARYIAIKALLKCENNGYSNLILKNILEASSLSNQDKGFVSILVYGVIEKQYTLEYILSLFLPKGLDKRDKEVKIILRSQIINTKLVKEMN